LLFQLQQTVERGHDLVMERAVLSRIWDLGNVADPQRRRPCDSAAVRVELARKHPQERRFAASVWSDDADARLLVHVEVDAREDLDLAVEKL
jgi:hypothetical protein